MRILWALVLMCMGATVAIAGETTLELREQLNRTWHHERVSWDLTFADKDAVPGGMELREGDAPAPLQVEVLETWGDSPFIKRARVATVVTTLEPLTTRTFTLTSWGLGKRMPVQGQTDLKVETTKTVVTLATERFAISVPVGSEAYNPAVAADTVPGPIAGWKLSDGTWMGGSAMYGDKKIVGRKTELTNAGPVTASAQITYLYDDSSTLIVTVSLDAQAAAAEVEAMSSAATPGNGWRVLLGGTVKPTAIQAIFGQRHYATERAWKLDPADEPVGLLAPWVGDKWFVDRANAIRFPLGERADHLIVSVHDVGRWVEPQTEAPWFRFDEWDFPTIGEMWSGIVTTSGKVQGTADGVIIAFDHVASTRIWSVGVTQDAESLLKLYKREEMSGQSPMPSLEDVQRMVLDWPDGDRKHPVGLITPAELEAAKGTPAYAKNMDIDELRSYMNKLGSFDIFRYVVGAAGLYDTMIDSDLIKPDERRLLKAQMAYLAYVNADPLHWSYDRGYSSGNPNMSVARITNVGKIACVLYDHPMSDEWYAYTERWFDFWLDTVLDEDGGWPESTHYARVAVAEFMTFAIVSRSIGRKDYLADERVQRMAMFYEKTLTPPDPMRRNSKERGRNAVSVPVRVPAPYGRGTRGGVWGLGGMWAHAFAESNPELSRQFMWSWNRTNRTRQMSHALGHQQLIYLPSDLPEEKPEWTSEYLTSLGYLLRDRVGEPDENYLLFISKPYQSPDGHLWPPDTGAIAKWFARGVPVAGSFRRIPEVTSVLTVNRVTLASNWDPAKPNEKVGNGYRTVPRQDGFSTLPTGDYASVHFSVGEIVSHHLGGPKDMPAFPARQTVGEVPLEWQRQLLLVRGDQEFLVLRDTVASASPTQWQFWTLSERIGTPAEAADREAFLAGAPGDVYTPARELKGDRFVAVGKRGMDLDYYIASPSDTSRHTLRFGTKGSAYDIQNFLEYQDLMYLQLEGAGTYYVAIFPRAPGEAAPEFTTMGDGTVIRVKSATATTWCFLSDKPTSTTVDGIEFQGTAGVVTIAGDRVSLGLSAAGAIRYGGQELKSDKPASKTVAK